MSWQVKRAMRSESDGVLAEAIAIVEGRVADLNAGRAAAPWMWVNKLAHASWSDLQDLAERRPRAASTPWDGAAAFLAGEIRAATGGAAELLAVQRAGLIPLELDLLDGRVTPPRTAAGLVAMVRTEVARTGHAPPVS